MGTSLGRLCFEIMYLCVSACFRACELLLE